jgi:hypothetical protein
LALILGLRALDTDTYQSVELVGAIHGRVTRDG